LFDRPKPTAGCSASGRRRRRRRRRYEHVGLVIVAEDRDQWFAFVNTVMNIRLPRKAASFLTRLAVTSS
jgi:hypothetical protein